ncbi:unnamed protein product [Boreogadus saida]
MRRRCGGPGGWPGGGPGGDGPGGGGRLGDPAVEVRRRLVIRPTSSSSMEGKLFLQVNLINEKIKERSHELVSTDLRPAVQRSRDSMWNRRLKGRPDVRQLGVMVQRPNAALNYTSVSYSP